MKCKICDGEFNPEVLAEVLIHEHVEGLFCDAGIVGIATGKKYTEKESISVAEISFNVDMSDFDLEYRNGKRYRYFDFPHALFNRALNSESIGAFLSSEVRGKFRYACINGD